MRYRNRRNLERQLHQLKDELVEGISHGAQTANLREIEQAIRETWTAMEDDRLPAGTQSVGHDV